MYMIDDSLKLRKRYTIPEVIYRHPEEACKLMKLLEIQLEKKDEEIDRLREALKNIISESTIKLVQGKPLNRKDTIKCLLSINETAIKALKEDK